MQEKVWENVPSLPRRGPLGGQMEVEGKGFACSMKVLQECSRMFAIQLGTRTDTKLQVTSVSSAAVYNAIPWLGCAAYQGAGLLVCLFTLVLRVTG